MRTASGLTGEQRDEILGSEGLQKGHQWECFRLGGDFLDLWRGALLTLRARKKSSGVHREQAMLLFPSDYRPRESGPVHRLKRGRKEGQGGERGLLMNPMLMAQKAERILLRRFFVFLLARNS